MAEETSYGAYSPARAAHGLVFTAGHVGVDQDGIRAESFRDEVRLAIEGLARTLEEHGSSLSELVSVNCILSDIEQFDEFNQTYSELIPSPFPPRFTHGGQLVQNFRFEIIGIAMMTPHHGGA